MDSARDPLGAGPPAVGAHGPPAAPGRPDSQDLVFFDATTRLARKLLELAEEHGEPTGDGEQVRITVRLTQEEMAQMIGVTRESANRLIAPFADRGWIDWGDGRPLLLRPESLLRRSH